MTTTTEKMKYQESGDRILANLVKKEAEGLTEALAAKDYNKARRRAKRLAVTIREINRTLEARE